MSEPIKLPPMPEPKFIKKGDIPSISLLEHKYLMAELKAACTQTYAIEAALQSQDREDAELLKIGRAIYRACVDLPIGCEVRIELEYGAATVRAIEQDGEAVMIDGDGDPLSGQIHQAIDHARRVEGEGK